MVYADGFINGHTAQLVENCIVRTAPCADGAIRGMLGWLSAIPHLAMTYFWWNGA